MPYYRKSEVEEARELLARFVKRDATIYTVLRSVARSGMSRRLSVFVYDEERGDMVNLTGYAARAFGYALNDDLELRVDGANFDAGFAVKDKIGRLLFADGYALSHRGL